MSSTAQKMNDDNPIWQTEEGKYFTEIEEYFSRKKAFPTLLSVKEWFLVKSWYEEGIPLSLIKGAIDTIARRKDFGEKYMSLSYCKNEVLREWKDYKKAMVSTACSGVEETKFEIGAAQINAHLEELIRVLENIIQSAPADYQVLTAIFQRYVNAIIKLKYKNEEIKINAEEFDTLEHKLTDMEHAMIKKIIKKLPDNIFKKILSQAKEIFSKYDNVISQVAYDRTMENFVRKSLMKELNLPHFSIYNVILSQDDESRESKKKKDRAFAKEDEMK